MAEVGITTNMKKVITAVLKNGDAVTKGADVSTNPPPSKKPRKKLKQQTLSWAKHPGVNAAVKSLSRSQAVCIHSLVSAKKAPAKRKTKADPTKKSTKRKTKR